MALRSLTALAAFDALVAPKTYTPSQDPTPSFSPKAPKVLRAAKAPEALRALRAPKAPEALRTLRAPRAHLGIPI